MRMVEPSWDHLHDSMLERYLCCLLPMRRITFPQTGLFGRLASLHDDKRNGHATELYEKRMLLVNQFLIKLVSLVPQWHTRWRTMYIIYDAVLERAML